MTLAMLVASHVGVALAADSEWLELRNNPFDRPAIVKAPPPPPPPEPVHNHEDDVELNLSATLVSPVAPMVIVNGKLLAIGDSIEHYRLVAVREGSADFRLHGRKYTFEIIQPRPN